jgi:acetyl-CoA C-acetyltransferase
VSIDPRTPVIVAVGQSEQRPADPATALEPIDLLAESVRLADASLGAAALATRADTIAVVEFMSAKYPDPGRALARRIGADPARTVTTTIGGNTPQMLVHHFGRGIQAGAADVVIIGGVETVYTRARARKVDPPVDLGWGAADVADPECTIVLGDDRAGTSDYENAHGAIAPTSMYPLFETAIRHAEGRTIEEHRRAVGAIWEHFAAVAATNPHAWTPQAYTADEITLASPDNRMVTFPYTKRMCANIQVDQAAAIILCSYEAATAAGVPADLMVFPWSGAEATDHFFVTERWSIADSPAIAAADVGIAVSGGTDIAVATADIALLRGGLTALPLALGLARATMRTIRGNLFWAFVYNVIGIPIATGALHGLTGFQLSPVLASAAMSLSSVSVLANSLRLRRFGRNGV